MLDLLQSEQHDDIMAIPIKHNANYNTYPSKMKLPPKILKVASSLFYKKKTYGNFHSKGKSSETTHIYIVSQTQIVPLNLWNSLTLLLSLHNKICLTLKVLSTRKTKFNTYSPFNLRNSVTWIIFAICALSPNLTGF